jgi:O-antigen/teichoic acid export membrane protein
MSRSRRFAQSLVSGYLYLAASVLYGLGSVPVALHYLANDEFGLWATASQLAGFLALVDLGMSGAAGRILVDYKDRTDSTHYGATIQTSLLVGLVQAAAVAGLGLLVAALCGRLPNVSAELERPLQWLVLGQSAILALGFPFRFLSNLLWAHQRLALLSYLQAAGLALTFILQWGAFHWGLGIYSLLLAQAVAALTVLVAQALAVERAGLFPARGLWGRPTWARFKEVFAYGKDYFLFTVGSQIINASQTLLVTPCLGLDAAATWAVCTRTYQTVCQIVWRVFDLAAPQLSEMFARGEEELLGRRFKSVTVTSVSLAVLAAALFAVCNQPFVAAWTRGRIGWASANDLLLALWAVLLTVQRCHVFILGARKDLQTAKYVYLGEGFLFLLLASLATPRWGFPALIASSIIATAVCSLPYGLRRTMKDFRINWAALAGGWMAPPARLLALFAPLSLAGYWLTASLRPVVALAILGTGLGTVGGCLLFRLGLDRDSRSEITRRLPRWLVTLLNAGLPTV